MHLFIIFLQILNVIYQKLIINLIILSEDSFLLAFYAFSDIQGLNVHPNISFLSLIGVKDSLIADLTSCSLYNLSKIAEDGYVISLV